MRNAVEFLSALTDALARRSSAYLAQSHDCGSDKNRYNIPLIFSKA